MSDFSSLKKQRKAKELKSYVATSPTPSASIRDLTSDSQNEPNPDANAMKGDINETLQTPCATDTTMKFEVLKTEGLYKTFPDTLDIRIATNGRGIYSKYHRKPGDVLFSVKPHVAALSNEHLDEYCSSCFSPKSGSLQRCTGCKLLCYCDSKCQNADWNLHKQECSAIQRWASSAHKEKSGTAPIPGDAIRCLGRILSKKRKLGPGNVWAREMDAMESHRTLISKDPNSHDSQVYTQLAHAVVRFLGLTSSQDMADYNMQSAADLVDLVSRFTTNTFTISTPALAPLGACVSPTVALINHSCDPNAVVVFPRASGNKLEEPLMQVIALKHISPDEEVLTAYIDTTLPRDKRQKMLQETYHFSCRCSLCAPSLMSTPDLREAMWCPKKCGGVCTLPTEENSLTRCIRCKTPVRDTDAVLDAVRVGEEALHKAEALQFSNPKKSIQLTTNLVPILVSAGLVPAAYPLLALSRLNASLLIAHLPSSVPAVEEVYSPAVQASHCGATESQKITPDAAQEALDEVIRAATRASTGLSQILTEGHPVRGIALAELGKLLSVDESKPAHIEPNAPSNPQTAPSSPSSFVLNPKLQAAPYPPSGPARLKLAYETLVRARMELMIGFGTKNEGGEVGKQVRQSAVDIEKELMVWKSGVRNALQDRPPVPK